MTVLGGLDPRTSDRAHGRHIALRPADQLTILPLGFLSTVVGVAFFDAVVASVIYLFVLPVLAIVLNAPWILLAYVIDVPAVLVPVLVAAWRRGEVVRALVSLPSSFLLRTVNGFFMLEAIVTELILRRPLLVYEKGH